MPGYPYLYKEQKIVGQGTPDALRFPPGYKNAPAPGYEIVPTDEARALVTYLLSLKLDYELPEAKFSE
jgi:cytochrome c oxidase cbb3-type subunit 2